MRAKLDSTYHVLKYKVQDIHLTNDFNKLDNIRMLHPPQTLFPPLVRENDNTEITED